MKKEAPVSRLKIGLIVLMVGLVVGSIGYPFLMWPIVRWDASMSGAEKLQIMSAMRDIRPGWDKPNRFGFGELASRIRSNGDPRKLVRIDKVSDGYRVTIFDVPESAQAEEMQFSFGSNFRLRSTNIRFE